MQLEFFGAAGEVTGSCHIVCVGCATLLLDCGLIQGGDRPDLRNRGEFPFDAARIDAVVLSHAHLDHCGRLPLLYRRGFRGPIHATRPCRDLARILLADSANLAARDVERENRRRAEVDVASASSRSTRSRTSSAPCGSSARIRTMHRPTSHPG